MGRALGPSGFDGTTGRSDHGGRRTHIIQLLRDSATSLSVAEVAEAVDIHINTARFHLESLVDAGMASRTQAPRDTPGRPRILYTGTLPNQTHERAQGYRLLAEILTVLLAQHVPDAADVAYNAGRRWGRSLASSPGPFEAVDERGIDEQLVEKMDALWFAPELLERDPATLVLHNCPFLTAARRNPEVVCSLHAGLINGTLETLESNRRAVQLKPFSGPHRCVAVLGPGTDIDGLRTPIIGMSDQLN